MSNRCENCKHVRNEFGPHICTIDEILVTESYCCEKWEDSHPAQAISDTTDNTSQQQIEELRAIADTAMRFLENNRDEKRRMVKVSDHMAYLDLCNRYNRERESR